MFYDAHNHLQDASLAPFHAQILADLAAASVARVVVNGTCLSDWPDVAALAQAHAVVMPSFGLHPWDVGNAHEPWRAALESALTAHPSAGVGEIGLDRWILDRAKPDDPRLAGLRRAPLAEQLEAFTWQLALAARLNRPATIHCLDAWGALQSALHAMPLPARGFLVHAFGGSIEVARDLAALGAYFSFNTDFLAERHAGRRAVFAALPADRLLVETDAPAMPPPVKERAYPLPGRADGTVLNHPANVTAAYAGLAAVRGVPLDPLTTQVAENFRRLFG